MTQYRLIRSRRRTLALEIKNEGAVVRAPLRMPKEQIDRFVADHEEWIKSKLNLLEAAKKTAENNILSEEDLRDLYIKAKAYIPERVKYYGTIMGLEYGRITIRSQKTRWGSCSSKKNLNFNCLLMLTPPEIIDSVVVHELCHLREMNHSRQFYAECEKYCPDYRKKQKWLKDNGKAILLRME